MYAKGLDFCIARPWGTTGASAVLLGASLLLIPLAGSATHVVDVFDGRNVIGTCGAIVVLLAIGLGCARAGDAGALLGLCLCALSLAVNVGIDVSPAYQRDDWRGAARALASAPASGRAIVVERYGSVPLAVYLPRTHALTAPSVSTRELDVIVLRTKRTGRSPLSPAAPRTPPPGFRLAYTRQTSTYAVSRFLAPHATVALCPGVTATSIPGLGGLFASTTLPLVVVTPVNLRQLVKPLRATPSR